MHSSLKPIRDRVSYISAEATSERMLFETRDKAPRSDLDTRAKLFRTMSYGKDINPHDDGDSTLLLFFLRNCSTPADIIIGALVVLPFFLSHKVFLFT